MISTKYAAGLFDGEGFVRIDDHFKQPNTGNPRFQLHAGMSMTYYPVVKMFFDRWAGLSPRGYDRCKNKYPNARNIFQWSVVSLGALRFLLDIREFSIVKRDEIEIGIAFQEHLTRNKSKMVGKHGDLVFRQKMFAERQIMCDQMRALKKREFHIVTSDPFLTTYAARAKV